MDASDHNIVLVEEVVKFCSRISDAIAIPANDTPGRRRTRTRTGIGMDASDEEEQEKKATREKFNEGFGDGGDEPAEKF